MKVPSTKKPTPHLPAYLLIYLVLALPLPTAAQFDITLEGKTYQLVLARNLIKTIRQAKTDTPLVYKRIIVQGPFELVGDTLNTALTFVDARFSGPVIIENTLLSGPLHFLGAHFQQDLSFFGTHFDNEFSCRDCRLKGKVNFKRTSFADKADFSASHFEATSFFTQAHFKGESSFERSQFSQNTYFDRATFSRPSQFQDASFADKTSFKAAIWHSTVSFAGVRFEEDVLFEKTLFKATTTFDASYFRHQTDFGQADFAATASFHRVVFAGPVRFAGAHFRASARFDESRFKAATTFARARFTLPFRPRAVFGDTLDLTELSAPLIDIDPHREQQPTPPINTTALECASNSTQPIQFVDITQTAGLDFTHYNGFTGEYYYVETFGAGAAFLDFDNDGWLDLYLVNGAPLSGDPPVPTPTNHLYRNTGTGRFADMTDASQTGHTGYGMGCAVGDYDNDGHTDIYVSNYGPNLLLHNTGTGHFTDATASGESGDGRWGTSSGFLDYDNDGDLDLYTTNYVDFSPQNNVVCAEGGIRSYCEPKFYQPVADILYRNDDGRFVDITIQAGITLKGRGLGVAFSDYDLDGDTDIYVANDGTMNFLYQNQTGHFAEVGLHAGGRYNEDGLPEAGMGVEFGDWDRDGFQDLFVTNFAHQTNTLYHNNGQGQFADITKGAGLAEPSYKPLGFGTNFFDYDNDSDLDLFVANGHVMDKITEVNPDHTYPQPNQIFCNQQGTRFVDVSTQLGPALEAAAISRASATADYDNDGDLDLLVTNIAAAPNLLRNDGGNRHNWLSLQLKGRTQPDALGAHITITANGQRQSKERQSGGSYLSSSDPRLHFGLGTATRADIQIRWPDGSLQHIEAIEANQILHITQSTP